MRRFNIGVSVRREDRLRARNAVALRALQCFLRFPLRPLPSRDVRYLVGIGIDYGRGIDGGLAVQGTHPGDMESDTVRPDLRDREVMAARNRIGWFLDHVSRENRGITPAIRA